MKANTHAFNVELATELGDVNQALMLQHFYFWYQNNKGKDDRLKGDHLYPWSFNKIEDFCGIFPYMSKGKINGAISKLVEKHYVITGNYNKLKFDKTKWYSLTEKGLILFDYGVSHNENSSSKNENPDSKNDNSGSKNENAIPYSNPNNNPNSNLLIKKSDDNILLDKLVENYPGNIGSTKPILKVIKELTREEKILSYNNLKRYSNLHKGFYHNLRNYLEGRYFIDKELDKKEQNNKKQNNIDTKDFDTNY